MLEAGSSHHEPESAHDLQTTATTAPVKNIHEDQLQRPRPSHHGAWNAAMSHGVLSLSTDARSLFSQSC